MCIVYFFSLFSLICIFSADRSYGLDGENNFFVRNFIKFSLYFLKYLIYLRFERTEVIKLLLERGADPLIENEVEMSALDSAVRTRDVEICILLLEKQRVKNYLSQGNLKPLFIACHDGKREVCELFLTYGVDLTRPGFRGSTPLHTAAFQGHEDVCELFIETGNITYTKMKVDIAVKKTP